MIGGLLLALAAGGPAQAAACPLPLVGDYSSYPGDGDTAVPLDGVVLVTYRGTSPAIASPGLALEDSQQAPVATTVTELPSPGPDRHVYLVVPTQPLAAHTEYYLEDTVDWNCTAEPCTIALAPKHAFTTTASTDTTPPPVPGAPVVATQAPDVCTDASCCGPYHALITNLANPATGAVRYDLYDDDTLVETNAPFAISTDCAEAGDVAYQSRTPSVPLAAGTHHLSWHGFDEAGNEAVGTQSLTLTLDCSAATATPDAGPPAADASGNPDMPGNSGCGCQSSSSSPLGAAPFALAMLIALRRRRR